VTQSLYEGFGGLALPVDAADVTTTLTPLDPARAVLSGLFRAAINAELGPAWTKATAGTPLASSSPVQDVLEIPPTADKMKQRVAGWPLLCVYRDGDGVCEEHTLNGGVERLTQPWTVDYILGPVDIADLRKLGDVFQAVVKIVRLCIRRRGHEAYQGGALQFFPGQLPDGDVPLFPRSSLLGAVSLKGYSGPPTYQARFAGSDSGTIYHAISLRLETVEYTYDVDGAFPPIEAFDLDVGIGGGEGIVSGLVYASSDAPFQYP
jgi:hypothetical protein